MNIPNHIIVKAVAELKTKLRNQSCRPKFGWTITGLDDNHLWVTVEYAKPKEGNRTALVRIPL